MLRISILLVTLSGLGSVAFGADVRVAVSSQFDFTLEELKESFEQAYEHRLVLVPGPSARLYGRIMSGESFDVFLSDDPRRTEALHNSQRFPEASVFPFSRSQLALWSVRNRPVNPSVLQNGDFELLSMTDPKLSPFGQAAMDTLKAFDAWESLQDKLVFGENIGQTYHFAISGDVDMALIPFSQLIYGRYMQAGNYWLVPDAVYSPIENQGIQLTDNPGVEEFLSFLKTPAARAIIRGNGFASP